MMKSRVWPVAVSLVLVWWAVSLSRSFTKASAPPAPEESGQVVKVGAAPAPAPSPARKAAPKTAVPAPVSSVPSSPKDTPMPFVYREQISAYAELRAKVFLSPAEQARKRQLLRDSPFLRAMGKRLVEPSRSEGVQEDQDAGVDLLLEALREGDSGVAAEVLRDVVQDPQIENAALDMKIREQLAGIKAEVLYQWSAQRPAVTDDLVRWLPGPVSQKIWANVVRMQQSNLAESEAERRSLKN
ncbi:MAG: hypothetical protein HC902_14200 [Calothrix sp. SM1_5_4]|nr:hypothetical protein [Calothrix sp. SM1_5_4]